jgi:hypothetical protein
MTDKKAAPRAAGLLAAFLLCLPAPVHGRTLVVNQAHPKAGDENAGTEAAPLRTINAAAQAAEPGDTVLVHAGVYRERVAPARGGTAEAPIVYRAAAGEEVRIKGSDVWEADWRAAAGHEHVYVAPLEEAMFRTGAPAGAVQVYNPCRIPYQTRAKMTLGQVFVDGRCLREMPTVEAVYASPGTWRTDGKSITVHFPRPHAPPERRRVELTTRGRIFAPYRRGLAHIHVRGFLMSHCANNYHDGFYLRGSRFPQAGALSPRGGHHWVIENNTVRWAKSTGIDCGYEGAYDADGLGQPRGRNPGHHLIRNNIICDNGAAGIVGCRTPGTRIIGNVIARNDRLGVGGTETAGIKLHFFTGGLIEGNLIRDNDTSGIWLDNVWRGSRVTRNVIVGNSGAALFIEMGYGPLMVDNNVLALSTAGRGLAGDGVYSHDGSAVTLAHNLIFFNANFGVWAHVGTDRHGGRLSASRWRVLNNLIVGNHRGAVSLPAVSDRSRDNRCDYNLIASAYSRITSETYGQEMDHPLFVCNPNKGRVPMAEIVARFAKALDDAKAPPADRPNLKLWAATPLLTLDHWRLLTGFDKHSRVPVLIRPQLSASTLELSFVIDDSPKKLTCEPVAGVTADFFGREIPGKAPLPGPFQDLVYETRLSDRRSYVTAHRGAYERLREAKVNRFVLWPMAKREVVGQTWQRD